MSAPDTSSSSAITDHPFIAPPGEPWGLCVAHYSRREPNGYVHAVECGLARSAHAAELEPYAPDTPHAEEKMCGCQPFQDCSVCEDA